MTVKQAIKVLKKHNNWRRGGYSHPQDPKIIGEAIDVAKEVLKGIDFKEAVYCAMPARDGHCHWVTVGYK